jgi:signal transduction histidine kinase
VAGLGEDAERALTMLLPLVKAIFLDIGLTLDAYFHQATRSLRFALDMVWKANNELRQFAQLTSHDLKTPLATVANLCDEALDEFGDAMPREARQLIEAARNRTFRMSATIDELLESSLSAARGDGEDEVMGDDFVDDAIERVRPVLEKKQIEVAVARPLPRVWGNKIRLREAFYNLVANAAKFIDRTAGRIDITAEIRDEECVFCVADNGPGIHADELERVFTPFRRMKAHRGEVRTELGSGSGLGLYFTKSIVEQYGGRIWVESRVGDGSRFYVALPRTGSRTDAARADAASRGRRDFTG